MKNISFNTTVPHLLSPVSAFNAENKPYINTLRFNFLETFQINQSNYLISNNAFVQIL